MWPVIGERALDEMVSPGTDAFPAWCGISGEGARTCLVAAQRSVTEELYIAFSRYSHLEAARDPGATVTLLRNANVGRPTHPYVSFWIQVQGAFAGMATLITLCRAVCPCNMLPRRFFRGLIVCGEGDLAGASKQHN